MSRKEEKIYHHIKMLGLSRKKANYLYKLSEMILNKFDGLVPENFRDLESLPGVGHKTASVVLSQGLGIPTFPVDTHIHRLAQRWELTDGKDVNQTENDLKKLFNKNSWGKIHLQLIFFGREHCTARGCNGTECVLCKTLFPNRERPFFHNKA